jgi:histidyl-tRNA synthetase
MKDFESDEFTNIEIIRQKFIDIAKLFGFKLMDPSPIESLSTLEAKSGPAIREEIYFFKDKGERDVALRFDFTVGLTRYVASQKSLKLPAKFGSFGGVFRYDEPQKGRYRFFHQWNVEIFGKPSLESESEIIEFTSRLFDSLNIQNIQIQLNHRKIVESFIKNNYPYFDPKQHEKIFGDSFRLVDKVAKKSRDDLLREYEHMPSEFVTNLLDFAEIKGTYEEIEQKTDVTKLDSWNYLKELSNSLKNRGVENFQINFGIVRGLDYYSGMVFEVFDIKSKLGALAGGGRYDSLTKAFGREDIGATGVAGGVERMILTMEEQGISQLPSKSRVSVLYVNEDMQKLAMNLVSNLRLCGIITEVDLLGRPLKKQMETASDSKYTIIVAPKEIAEKKIVIRNMSNGTETQVLIDDLISNPTSILNL